MGEEPLQRIVRLAPLDHVLARIDALVRPVAARSCELESALGRTVAVEIRSEQPVPPVPLALRAGWAVRSELTTDASPFSPMPVPSAARVETGSPLPPEADSVAPLDAVVIEDGLAQALSPIAPGEGVLSASADAAQGSIIIPAGWSLDRMRIALLSALGIARVQVRDPRLRVLPARAGSDPVIAAAVQGIAQATGGAGATALVSEATEPLERALTAMDADAAFVVGGTGSGTRDETVRTLARLGQVETHGVALVPAETSAFAMLGEVPVLALPGRLDAALAAWHMLGRAILSRLASMSEPQLLRTARITRKITSSPGVAELVPVLCEGRSAHPLATGYAPISALARANGWVFIDPGSEGYQANSEVVIRPWP
jgi:molybdopterin molybdotransferase